METSDPKYKHKPSEKHTLEEVLKSLQDLIRNDLAEGVSGTAKPEPAPAAPHQRENTSPGTTETKPRRDNISSLREDFAPVAPGSGPVNLDAVMRSLKDLIGNELNVGETPSAPAEAAPASTHEEYLASEEKIEEYIPEELGQPGDEPGPDNELNIGIDEIPEEPGLPPRDESLVPEEIIEETLPQGFTPLDEELTLEELAETAPPPSAPPATPELPGEISPELLIEPEPTPPPTVPETLPAMGENLLPGTQQEMFLDEPPPIELRVPPPPDTKTAPALEPAPEPETPAAPMMDTLEVTESESNAGQTLPTIEVEESFDTGNYFDTAEPPVENPPVASEELITLDMEISGLPETASPAVETSPAISTAASLAPEPPTTPSEELITLDMEISSVPETASPAVETTAPTPTDAPPAPEPPAAPVEKKITLEIVNEPTLDSPRNRAAADFDALSLEPIPPEPTPVTPAVAETPAPEAELPVIAIEPDLSPVPAPETPKAKETTAVPEIKAETAPAAEPPATPAQPGATESPPRFNLDDIPVLNEVVAPPAGSVPTPATPPAPPLPAPDRARDLVVRAVAKLNVEMRKTGGAGLDTKTILRLQQLIRQELEKIGEK